MKQEIPVNEIRELLETVSTKVPELIRNLLRTVYSQEAGSEMGKAVGNLYKELIAGGLPEDVAVKLATDYMFSLKDVMKGLNALCCG
ncbi:MAG: hypothetical protein K6T83_22795 [Alicyclobacillus sp.]|nr:hypothetical protein [Alicyclobacillus sp.]